MRKRTAAACIFICHAGKLQEQGLNGSRPVMFIKALIGMWEMTRISIP
jgi:hypothetical protein